MPNPYDFLDNETRIVFHKTSHDGHKTAERFGKSFIEGKAFISTECHPDFWPDFLDGLSAWIESQRKG